MSYLYKVTSFYFLLVDMQHIMISEPSTPNSNRAPIAIQPAARISP